MRTPRGGDFGGPVVQTYDYDQLYRLTGAEGRFTPGKQDEAYTLSMVYDGIHNITNKTQRHVSLSNNGTEKVIAGTSYDWAYSYKDRGHSQPHAPTHIGNRKFDYDLNGNLTQWTHDQNGSRRSLNWDEENRIQSITDQGTTSFLYDDQGQRVIKDGDTGQIAYLNQYYTVKNNSIPTKHVYAGTTRIVSKRLAGGNATNAPGNWNDTKRNNGNGQGNNPAPATTANTGTATGTAAANAVATDTPTGPGKSQGLNNRSARANDVAQNTNKNPNLTTGHPGQGINNRSDRANERAQNTVKNPNLNGVAVPPGGGNGNNNGNNGNNAWQPEQHFLYYYHPDHLGSTSYVTDTNGKLYEHIQYFPFGETWVQQAHNTERTPYQYTSKELDEETGLYYYGARYYDPRTSVWQSADPVLGKYLPTGNREQDARLPGLGGVFTTPNLGLYTYTHQNPVRLIDPDGREAIGAVVKLLIKGGERFKRWITSKQEAIEARKQGETIVFKTKQQAKQVEEAVSGGDKSKIMRHKGHKLKDGSQGRPHYQTEDKKGHSMWGKLGVGGVAGGLAPNDAAEAGENEVGQTDNDAGLSSKDIGEFLLDLFIPGGLEPLGEGSDITPDTGYRQQPKTINKDTHSS